MLVGLYFAGVEMRVAVDVNLEEALEQVEDHLNRGISNIRRSRAFYQRGSQLQAAALAMLSATTTLLIALHQIYHRPSLVALSLITGTLATAASAWTTWFGFRQLWLAATATLAKLWALRDQIEYDKALYGNDLTPTMIDKYNEQFLEIFEQHNRSWEYIRSIGQ